MFYNLLSYVKQHEHNSLLVVIENFNDNWINVHQIKNKEFNVVDFKTRSLVYNILE